MLRKYGKGAGDLRALSLQALPGDDVAEHVEPPASKPGEVDVGRSVVEPERLADERFAASLSRLPEVIEQVAWLRQRRLR